MAFDPYNFYQDGKRKEQRWASVTPFILVGLLLLIMAIDGYLSYKVYVAPVRRNVIPYTKPTTPEDITNLMEQISPTPDASGKKNQCVSWSVERGYFPVACDGGKVKP